MLSTIALVAAGLSSGHKLGLALVGAAFIVFALISSFVVPIFKPNFPGKNMGWFVAGSVLFFLAMVGAVLVFGKESKEATTGPEPTTAVTTTTASAPAPTTTTAAAPSAGDPVAGKAVFGSAGCAGCHTLKAAGATGTVGPNLDDLKPPLDRIVLQVNNGGKIMPPFKGQLSPTQIQDVAAFVYQSTHS